MGVTTDDKDLFRRPLPALHLTLTPRMVYRLAGGLTLLLIALPFALTLVPWQQNIVGKGRVIGAAPTDRQQSVKAPVDGRILRWYVAEGSVVARGEKLLEMTDNDPLFLERLKQKESATLAKLNAGLAKQAAYEAQIAAFTESRRLAMAANNAEVQMAVNSVDSAERDVEAAAAELETAQLNADRVAALLKDGLISQRDHELAILKLRQSTAKLASSKAKLGAEQQKRESLESKRDKITSDIDAKINSAQATRDNAASEVASARSALLEVETKLARQRQQLINAPCDGTILRLATFGAGEIIKEGEPLLVIVPKTEDLAIEVWVDGNDMPLITAGRPARIQFEGWPAVQFVGWPSVAVGTFGGRVNLVDATDDGTGKFRIVVVPDTDDQPWPKQPYLRQGVRAKGWVLLDQVPLGYEIWRQLNGFPPTVKNPTTMPKDKVKISKSKSKDEK